MRADGDGRRRWSLEQPLEFLHGLGRFLELLPARLEAPGDVADLLDPLLDSLRVGLSVRLLAHRALPVLRRAETVRRSHQRGTRARALGRIRPNTGMSRNAALFVVMCL